MAATLSSFIPPIFRTNHQQSEPDFSYSYSELPLFRSKLDNVKDGGDQRPKSTCGVVSGVVLSPKRSTVEETDLYTKQYEERKAISLPYHHIDQHVSLPRAKYSGRSNAPPNLNKDYKVNDVPNANRAPLKFKIVPDKGKQFGEFNKSGGVKKGEETRKRFELQTTCTNLPQKKSDKDRPDAQSVNAAKLKKFEDTKKAIELQSAGGGGNGSCSFPQKLLTKGNSWESYSTYEGVGSKKSALQGKFAQEKEVFSRDARDFDKRNFPPKPDSLERKLDGKLKGNVSPKSLDFINDIGEYLNRSDCGSCDSTAGFNFSPSKSLDCGDNYNNNSDIKDPSTVASSVRRLRNSIFSSLKLPRKIGGSKMNSQAPLMGTLGRDSRNATAGKRKSAVELLAESKAFYVKSETVLDRKQELPLRASCPVSSTSSAHYATLSGRHRRGGGEPLQNQLRKLLGSTSMSPSESMHDPRAHPTYYPEKRRSSRDCCEWEIPSHQSSAVRSSHYGSGTYSANSSSGTSGSKGQVKSDPEHSRISSCGPYSTKSLNRPSSSGDNRIFFPDSFVIPKPSRSDPANMFVNNYPVASAYSSPEKIDARKILSVVDAYDDPNTRMWNYDNSELLEDFSTISPPAEYAITERSNYRYVRSNSHSQTMKAAVQDNYAININSHKSLPDLHKQGEPYVGDGSRRLSGASGSAGGANYLGVSCEMGAAMRSSEALSSYSKATSGRSNRSSVFSSKTSDGHSRRSLSCHNSDPSRGSAEDPYYYNRSGSSYARDSGGSSGHCSAGLGVPLAPTNTTSSIQRRDSGSSTQHSSARSHHRYSSYYEPYSPHQLEAPPQFQDGAPSPPRISPSPPHQHHLHHVAPLHPPEPPLALNATLQICANFGPRNMHGATVTRVATGVEESSGQTLVGIHFQASIPPLQFQDSQPHGYASYGSLGSYGRHDSGSRESRHSSHRPSSYGLSQNSAPQPLPRHITSASREELTIDDPNPQSPPGTLGNFRRQRCLRYKQRRPVLRSKSDISDRYWREGKGHSVVDKKPVTPPSSTDNESPDRITRSLLDKFFDQLGMNDETYQEVVLSTLKKPRSKVEQKNQIINKNSPSNLDFASVNATTKAFIAPEDETGVSSDSPIFSDISIADSNHIPNNGDYTVQGSKEPKPYRSCEPPSIVERNARIIKWLCNCRKLQSTSALP